MNFASKRVRTKKQIRDDIFAWSFFIPVSLYMIVFFLLPIIFVISISFTSWNGFSFDDIKFIGFENYFTFFTDKQYLFSLLNTVIMGALIIVFTMVIGFFLALLMNTRVFLRGFHRAAWYVPSIISFAVMSQIVSVLLLPDGVLNIILSQFGVSPIAWTAKTEWMFFWIIVLSVWRSLGITILLYIAGLTGISKDLYEAASLDGAGKVKSIFYVTLPLLKPMLAFILITSLINMFNIFEPVKLISEGGPEGTTSVIMYQIYNDAFSNFDMGMSSATSIVVMVIVMLLTLLSLRQTKLKI